MIGLDSSITKNLQAIYSLPSPKDGAALSDIIVALLEHPQQRRISSLIPALEVILRHAPSELRYIDDLKRWYAETRQVR